MSNVIQFRPSPAAPSTTEAMAPASLGAVLPFPSIEEIESLAIDDAAAEDDLKAMLRMSVWARSVDARSRARVWLKEIHNIRVT